LAESGELHEDELAALNETFERAAEALRGAGYFGPFGIDAFRYLDAQNVERFHPLGEINARYSMGWLIGMAE
jgi:hypothetical protein